MYLIFAHCTQNVFLSIFPIKGKSIVFLVFPNGEVRYPGLNPVIRKIRVAFIDMVFVHRHPGPTTVECYYNLPDLKYRFLCKCV